MASSAIESTAQLLGKLLVQEVEYLSTVKDKVEELRSELEWMQCFLWDADEMQNKDALLRKWISEIKDSALQAEDLIETYVLGIACERRNEFWVWFDLKWLAYFLRDAITLHNVGSDIDALSAKISKMSSRLQTYGVKSSYGKHSSKAVMVRKLQAEQRRTYSHVDDKDVVGLEECVRDLVDRLREDQQRIVVVHGMGGIGKTTLVREVFNYSRTKGRFDGIAWAYISQQLQLSVVCKEILLQLIPENKKEERDLVESLQDSQLPGKLSDMLKQKNYLVILDDVWFSRDWKCLEAAFPLTDTSHGSKLLVTTRNPQIFSGFAEDVVSYYQVKYLDHEKSWQLLDKKANIKKEDADPELVKLGDKMLDHCNGHPLAISVLGGVLATKKSVEEWVSVYDNLSSHLRGDDSHRSVYEVLAMSYYELPYHMKPCFLHLGYFPEDLEVRAEKLYHLWIAEGVVSSTQVKIAAKRSLEEICEVYLNELVQKGMVQVESRDSEGKISTFRLHDLMRDKCLEINKEEDFLDIIDYHASKTEHKPSFQQAPSEKLRRMAVYFDKEIPYPLPKSSSGNMPPLRSLLVFPSEFYSSRDCGWIRGIFKDYKLLRVLDLEGHFLVGSLPEEVGNLIFLRYLSLKGTCITQLPSSIGKLRSLMILDLRVAGGIIKFPNLLWKMKSLKYLYFSNQEGTIYLTKGYEIEENEMLKLDELSHLEKLEGVDLDRVNIEGLAELRSMEKVAATCSNKESLELFLKSISIKFLKLDLHSGILMEDPTVLSACAFLKCLTICPTRSPTPMISRRLPQSPIPMIAEMFPQNLVELKVLKCKFAEDPMPILEKLPKLRSLHLHSCYNGTELACSDKAFPMLIYLGIFLLQSIQEWTVEKGGFPKLQRLEIYCCPIKMVPDVLPPLVSINCSPCVRGIENYGTCPYFKGW